MSETSEALLVKNLNALSLVNTQLADRLRNLKVPDSHQIIVSKSGAPSLKVFDGEKSALLHSCYEPMREARQWLEKEGDGQADVLLFGFGLGYGFRVLMERFHDCSSAIIIEPDMAVFYLALCEFDFSSALSRREMTFIIGEPVEQALQSIAGALSGLLTGGQPRWLIHGASQQRFSAYTKTLRDRFAAVLESVLMNIRSQVGLGETSLKNIFSNLVRYQSMKRLSEFCGCFSDRTGVLVAAGPSLANNIDELKRAKGKALVVCVGTALKPLLKAGIIPDAVVILDFSPISTKYLEDIAWPNNTERPVLIADARATRTSIDAWGDGGGQGEVVFVDDALLDSLCLAAGGGRDGEKLNKAALDILLNGAQQSLTVAHLVFHVLTFLGVKEILLCGLDLSFSNGITHAPGTATYDEWQPLTNRFNTYDTMEWESLMRFGSQLREFKDEQGQPVLADAQMISYHEQFETLFSSSLIPVINACQGGRAKAHTQVKSLSESLMPSMEEETEKLVDRFSSKQVPIADQGIDLDFVCSHIDEHQIQYTQALYAIESIQTSLEGGSDYSAAFDELRERQSALQGNLWLRPFIQRLMAADEIHRDRLDRDLAILRQKNDQQALLKASFSRDKWVMDHTLKALERLKLLLLDCVAP